MPVFPGLSRGTYDVGRLIDHRSLEDFAGLGGDHVLCDIDKTYLETDFESITRMARIAFEDATDKVTVAGAPEVLAFSRWGELDEPPGQEDAGPACLHFVSSSPPQLRSVLSEKLVQDGLDWTSDTFKNQAYNLRMRRMDLLRQHIGYKSLAILRLIMRAGDGARFWMIGDNAESDPFIYLGIKLYVEGRLSPAGYSRYLQAGGLEEKVAQSIVDEVANIPQTKVVRILVRRLEGYDAVLAAPWTDVICFFPDYFQAVMQLMADDLIAHSLLPDVIRVFHNRYGHEIDEMMEQARAYGVADGPLPNWLQDRGRGTVTVDRVDAALPEGDEEEILTAVTEWCASLHRSKLKRRGKLKDIAD